MSTPTFPFNAPSTTEQVPVGYTPPTGTAAPSPTPPPSNPAPPAAPVADPTPVPTPAAPPAPAAPPPAPPATGMASFAPPTPAGYVPAAPPVASDYHQNVQHSGFTDDVKTGDYDAYKGQKGRADRLGFLLPRDLTWGRVHYVQDKGFFICDSKFAKQGGQEVMQHPAPCCQKLGAPKKRFAALIVQYGTDARGQLLVPFSFKFMVWRFNEQLFDQMRNVNRDFPLEQYDVMATCTDDQYWKYTITPARESLVHSQKFREFVDPADPSSTYGQQVDGYIAAMKPRLDRAVAKANTPQEWAELLGMPGMPGGFGSAPGHVVSGQGDAPIDNIAALLGGPGR